jgi:hypothetical protein
VTQDLDLFGDPIAPPVERRGRPRHVRSAVTAAQVRELSELGLAQPKIARMVRLSVPTLTIYYALELGSTSEAAQRRDERDLQKSKREGTVDE